MLGFTATYAGESADGVEVEAAGWFAADALPRSRPGSIAGG